MSGDEKCTPEGPWGFALDARDLYKAEYDRAIANGIVPEAAHECGLMVVYLQGKSGARFQGGAPDDREIARSGMLRARLQAIAEIIENVDHRAMAADGPVTPTKDEITADELRQIYNIANGGKSVTVRNPERETQ